MPKKNKVPLVDGSEAAPEDVVMGKDGFESALCGHINRHYYNPKGRLEDLACDLPKGHTGDHHAKHLINVPDPIVDSKGGVIEQHYRQEEADAYWGDAAGTPAQDIKAKDIPQLSQFQKDLVAEVMKSNPGMSAEDAVAEAKNSPIWLAGSA